MFESLEQVREITAAWLQSYNEERPHDALAGLPPATYRAQREARSVSLTEKLTERAGKKKSKFSEEQIAMALQQVDAGAPISEVTRGALI